MNRRDAIKAVIGAVVGAPATTLLSGESTGELVTPRTHGRCRVYDCYGREWKGLRWVHTGTGECEQIVRDILGRSQLNAAMTDIVTNKHRIPTPIRIVPIGESHA